MVNRNFTDNFNLSGGELFFKMKGEDNFSYFGATNEFKINFKSSTVEHKNSETATLVTDMEVTKEVEASLSFTTEDLNKNALAMAFSGKSADTTQTAGSATDVVFATVKSKSIYDLAVDGVRKVNVSDVVVYTEETLNLNKTFAEVQLETDYSLERTNVTNVVVKYDDDDDSSTEDATAVLDTDYNLDAETGVITIIDNDVLKDKDISVTYKAIEKTDAVVDTDYSVNEEFGTVEIADNGVLDGKDIKVSFAYAEVTLTNFSSLDETSREFTLRFVSANATGKPKETTVHRVKLSLNGDYSLKDLEKFTSLSFNGKVLLDSSKPEGKQFVETVMIG